MLVGARLVIASPEGHRDPNYLVEMIARHRITAMHFVPSMLAMFVPVAREADIEPLRLVMCGGEPLTARLVERLRAVSNAEVRNEYGPTEGTVTATRSEPLATDPDDVQIGRPVPNTQVYVLDSRLRPVGVGVPGEIYIAGAQLARGYLGRADLTAERFVANPFASGRRLYRTGDLGSGGPTGCWAPRATDFQVKLRGLRIGLGEIENVSCSDETVEQAVVALRHDDGR